jgi:hypothetical protein
MMLFCLVVAYVIVRAWEQARAQAGAEWRRAREHVAGEFTRRMAAGEASGPLDDWWWWLAAGRRAWRSMRGRREGARGTALPGNSPWRRIAQAAAAGAARGRAEGTRRAGERRRRRREARPAGGGRTPRGTGRGAGWAGFAAGWIAGQARWPRWRRPVEFMPVGVCDSCGAVCALPSMAYQRVDVGGRTETWLLCTQCRTEPAPEPASVPLAVQVAVQVNTAIGTGHASDGPLAVALQPAAVGGGTPETPPAPAGGPAQPGQPLPAAGPGPDVIVTDVPLGELAAGASPTETSTDGGQMSNELELADGGGRLPAAAGDAYSYGAWQRATATDAELLDQLGLALEAMLTDLTAASAGRTQVKNVADWADRVGVEAALTREAITEMDRRYRPVIAAVGDAGGTEEVSNTSYYREI